MELIRDWVATSTAGRWTSLMVFGCEPAHSPEMVQAGLNLLLQKGTEWSQQLPIFVSSSDVLSAFDYLTQEAGQEAAIYWDMPPDLVAAMAQETIGLSCGASLLSRLRRPVISRSRLANGRAELRRHGSGTWSGGWCCTCWGPSG